MNTTCPHCFYHLAHSARVETLSEYHPFAASPNLFFFLLSRLYLILGLVRVGQGRLSFPSKEVIMMVRMIRYAGIFCENIYYFLMLFLCNKKCIKCICKNTSEHKIHLNISYIKGQICPSPSCPEILDVEIFTFF